MPAAPAPRAETDSNPDTEPRAFIKHLRNAEPVVGIFALQNCQLGKTKAGKPFIKCVLGDKTGRAPGRMWSATEQIFNRLPTDGFAYVEGVAQPYQGEMQIIINRLDPAQPRSEELADLLPTTRRDREQMYAAVSAMLASFENPALCALRDRFLEDAKLIGDFFDAPAAMSLHHATLGGLLEHTWSLMSAADALLHLYPDVNREVVLFGLFLHDLGKVEELHWTTGFGYTEDGQLIGHIARGLLILQQKADCCDDPDLGDQRLQIPPRLLRALQHIILSHHGVPEFGALKIPATPEAIFVSQLDNLDAKMNMALDAAGRHEAPNPEVKQGDFTEKLWALGTKIFRPDPMDG